MANKVDGSEAQSHPTPLNEATESRSDKQIYLRTVYPLNPGIPHSVDFPTGWRRD